MQRLSVLGKVLRASHQPSHLFKHGVGLGIYLIPCAAEPVYRSGTERGNNGGEGGEVVHCQAFLKDISQSLGSRMASHTSATDTKCLITLARFLTSSWTKIISATQFVNRFECNINALTLAAGSES